MVVPSYEPAMYSEVPVLETNRRRGERFPLSLSLRFRHVALNENWTEGRSLNFSRTGILFLAERPTHLGASLEMVIDWPAGSEDAPKRILVIVGMVIRIRGNEVALSIRQHTFRGGVEQR